MLSRRGVSAAGIALVGLALMIFESLRTLQGNSLGTPGWILLYVGLAVFVVAAAVLIVDQPVEFEYAAPEVEWDDTTDTLPFDESD